MNRINIKLSSDNEYNNFKTDGCILDVLTSGRYWRNSRITNLTIISWNSDGLSKTMYLPADEKEEDELLTMLPEILASFSTMITFNGTSFDLPYLHAKLKAYGLPDPLLAIEHRDLYLEYSSLKPILGLPSRRLIDYASILGDDASDDAERTLRILAFDTFLSFLDGNFTVTNAEKINDLLVYTLTFGADFPGHISTHDEIYHLTMEGSTARLGVHILNEQLRVYHTDIKNYWYLKEEGYAVHASLAQFVDKKRKEKAVRTNCFHLVPYSESFISSEKVMQNYISSALRFLHSRQPDRRLQEPS